MASGIESQLTALIAATFGVDEAIVRSDSAFASDLGADSLDLVTLILAVEDQFQIDIYDEDVAAMLTVEQMIDYVGFAVAEQQSPVTSRAGSDRLARFR